jgi:DNA-methyltransferase
MATRNSVLNEDFIKEKLISAKISDPDEKIKELEKIVNKYLKSAIKAAKVKEDIQYDEGIPFLNVYPNYDDYKLPSWVIDNIDNARIYGNSKQMVILRDGRRYQLNNSLNHLSGKEWNLFLNSVINTCYSTKGKDSYAHHIRKIHPTPKPPQLMKEIIQFFSKENELVFDYFMGVGGSLLGAGLCGRKAIGIDLEKKYIEAYKAAAMDLELPVFKCIEGDCVEILSNDKIMKQILDNQEISLVLIDPPYGNMMSRKKTGSDIKVYGNVATPFSTSDKDFGNLDLYTFYDKLKDSVNLVLPYIKKRGYIIIFIKDLQPSKKETNLLHSKIIEKINEIPNINYKGMKIWADQSTKLFPYGYPFSYVSNQIHQYILVFRKEK